MRRFCSASFIQRYILISLIVLSVLFLSAFDSVAADKSFSVKGAVKKSKIYTVKNLKKMSAMFLKDVYLINEKKDCNDEEKLGSLAGYRGVLLRDILLDAGMKYKRKWEPGVLIRVKGTDGEAVFSFGEIFYSSIGRSIIVAYERKGRSMKFGSGCGQLIIQTDLRSGRCINDIREIEVERV